MKKSHKVSLGVFVILMVAFIVISSLLLYTISKSQRENYLELKADVENLKESTEKDINSLESNLLETSIILSEINQQVGVFNEELGILKAQKSSDFSGIIDSATDSVLTIRTDVAQGTGFIIENNFILTNAHVLSGGKTVYGVDKNQQLVELSYIGADEEYDIALLQANQDFSDLVLADSDEVKVGENVIAIGNPLGLQFSASEGIVSAVHRVGPNNIAGYIQTDAALNPGNSGGPLINTEGNVIGINNFKASGDNLGFALESNYIKEAVNKIAQEELNATIF